MLFRQITALKRNAGEALFAFYNRLISKVYEYKRFLESSLDKATAISRSEQADDYILDTFILAVGMNFRHIIIDREPKSIQGAYALLIKLEVAAGTESNDGVEEKLDEMIGLLKI